MVYSYNEIQPSDKSKILRYGGKHSLENRKRIHFVWFYWYDIQNEFIFFP